jgi:hypothetical protein
LNHFVRASPRLDLLLAELPQFVDLWRLARNNSLCHLHAPANSVLPHNSIGSSLGGNSNNADTRIIRSAIVLSITKVAQPGFQSRRVVFLDDGAIGDDLRGAGHGGPFAGGVEEGDVDVGVGRDVGGLARLGVGVEDEVDSFVFLNTVLVLVRRRERGRLTLAANAMQRDTRAPEEPSRVVIMPNLLAEMNSLRSSIFSLMEAWSRFFSLYGSAGLSPVSAFEKDILVVVKDLVWRGVLVVFALDTDAVSGRSVLV